MDEKIALNNEELEKVTGGYEYTVDAKGRYVFSIPAGESARGALDTCYRMFNCYGYLPFLRAEATLDAENMIHTDRKMIVYVEKLFDPGGPGILPHYYYVIHDVMCMAGR